MRIRQWVGAWGGIAIVLACGAILGIALARSLDPSQHPFPNGYRWKGMIPDVYETGGPPMVVAVFLAIVIYGGLFWFLRIHSPRGAGRPDIRVIEYTFSIWVFLLEDGRHYDGLIAGLAAEDMSRLTSRRAAAERLAAALAPWDIRDGFAVTRGKSRFPHQLAKDAKRVTDELAAAVAGSGTEPGDWCLLIFSCTDVGTERVPSDATPAKLAQALRISTAGFPGSDSVIFIRHRTLSEASGRRAVAALRDHVLVPSRTK